MPGLLPINLFFLLTSSALFHLAPSIPLSNQIRLIPHNTYHQSESPFQDSQPNTFVNGVPNAFFPKSTTNQKSSNETNRANKFGLWATGPTVPEKTILLNNGVAKFDATFTLLLRKGEELKGMRHRPDDTSIITSFEEARERHVSDFISYNITITHHFRGTVGVAQYELTIFTTKGAALRVSGVYYVAGIVVYASIDSKPPRIVSGIDSPHLTVDSLSSFSSFTGMSTYHRVMFPLKFQHVGPDVTQAPPSIIDQLSKIVISVESDATGGKPILSSNSSCEVMRKILYSSSSKQSPQHHCDVRLDLNSMSLELNFNPEGYGKAIIKITLPGALTTGEGMKTELRLNVLKPAIIRPELDLKKDLRLKLDYFGTESFFVPIRNKNNGDQKRKVLSYVLDLPGNRYAISDFNNSLLDGPTQFVSFSVIPKDREDRKLQEAIKRALILLGQSKRRHQRENISYVDLRQLYHNQNRSNPFQDEFLGPFGSMNTNPVSNDLQVTSVDLVREMNHSYQSHLHALFPRIDELVTAENPSGFSIRTSFSSEEVAQAEPLRVARGQQNMLFKLTLLQYTMSTFSRHKAMQISTSLSKQVSDICKTPVERANLVKIDDKGLNVEVTYHMVTPMKFTESDIRLNRYKKNISRSVTSDVLLRNGRLEVTEIVRLVRLGRRKEAENTASEPNNRLKGIKGILLGIFVALAVLVLIPLLILCVGNLVSSRRAADSSNLRSDRGEEEEPENNDNSGRSVQLPQPASDVLKDNYGRAEDGSYRSFKVVSGMTREGYFEDKAPAVAEKTISFAET